MKQAVHLPRWALLLGFALLAQPSPATADDSWTGFITLEGRTFVSGTGAEGQAAENGSLAIQAEYYRDWDDGDQSFRFTPFARWDQSDDERTHFDIRELYWQKAAQKWELAIGIRKIFWGVVESAHIVDVINQTDFVEDPDGEAKLGQPMVQFSWIRPWGTLDFFLLTGFRERTLPGRDGRLRITEAADEDLTEYESSAEQGHVDGAVRWSHSIGAFDLGISHFFGTGRVPLLSPVVNTDGERVVKLFYEQVHQTGIDFQATFGSWLWKLEGIIKTSKREDFSRFIGGFEYTFFSVGNSAIDVGGLLELSVDDRPTRTNTGFVATRLTFNDVQSTDLLFGVIFSEEDGGGNVINLEASRRIGDQWRLGVRFRGFTGIDTNSPILGFRKDDYLQIDFSRYF